MKAALVAAALVASLAGPNPLAHVVDLDGAHVDPFADARATAFALIFLDPECPVGNRAVPEIDRLHQEFSARGVRLWLVYPHGDATAARHHVGEFGLRLPALRDPRHELVTQAGVTVTPEAAVFSRAGRLMYRGRLDDRQVALGTMRPVATKRDLREALDAMLSRRLETPVFAPAVGCYIRPVS